LPTPCARDGKGPGHQYGLPDLIEGGPLGSPPQALLPAPVAHDTGRSPDGHLAMGAGLPGGARTGVTSLAVAARLLPTPTARAYGSNQSLSAGAAVRPSLATLAAHRLLPAPPTPDGVDAAPDTGQARATADEGGPGASAAPALLPTPRTSDGRGPAVHGDGGADLRTVAWLLPTPKATDGVKGCPAQRGSKGDLTLPSAAVRLTGVAGAAGQPSRDPVGRPLPTLGLSTARTASGRAATDAGRAGSRPQGQAVEAAEGTLPRELNGWVQASAGWQPPDGDTTGWGWGPYAEAVARWEQLLGRPAPAPTQPGTHGRPVLAPVFVEWLMGLPAGFVTGLGLPRTLALRVLGNGVVPQQAAVALRLLLCPHRWAVNP
jgi:DNA (cytosine-5)-methyltransferase 1